MLCGMLNSMAEESKTKELSASARAREWVLAQKPGTLFKLAAIPAEPHIASQVMTRLIAARPKEVERLVKGLFWRKDPESELFPLRDEMRTALFQAGPGGGMERNSALHKVGWTTQIPAKLRVCVLGRSKPTPVDTCVEFFCRSNVRRAELTHAEVTMIEAVRHFFWAEESWDDAIDIVNRGVTIGRLGARGECREGAEIHAERLWWGAQTEPRLPKDKWWDAESGPKEFLERIDDICNRIPEKQDWDTWMAERSKRAAERRKRATAGASAL